jgi:hypothetical protein
VKLNISKRLAAFFAVILIGIGSVLFASMTMPKMGVALPTTVPQPPATVGAILESTGDAAVPMTWQQLVAADAAIDGQTGAIPLINSSGYLQAVPFGPSNFGQAIFLGDAGYQLAIPFGSTVSNRSDSIASTFGPVTNGSVNVTDSSSFTSTTGTVYVDVRTNAFISAATGSATIGGQLLIDGGLVPISTAAPDNAVGIANTTVGIHASYIAAVTAGTAHTWGVQVSCGTGVTISISADNSQVTLINL